MTPDVDVPRPEPAGETRLMVHSLRGSDLHDYLCDAVLFHGGYVLVDDELYEVLGCEPDPERDAWAWLLVTRRHAGAA